MPLLSLNFRPPFHSEWNCSSVCPSTYSEYSKVDLFHCWMSSPLSLRRDTSPIVTVLLMVLQDVAAMIKQREMMICFIVLFPFLFLFLMPGSLPGAELFEEWFQELAVIHLSIWMCSIAPYEILLLSI